jgi:hypothetical protein
MSGYENYLKINKNIIPLSPHSQLMNSDVIASEHGTETDAGKAVRFPRTFIFFFHVYEEISIDYTHIIRKCVLTFRFDLFHARQIVPF